MDGVKEIKSTEDYLQTCMSKYAAAEIVSGLGLSIAAYGISASTDYVSAIATCAAACAFAYFGLKAVRKYSMCRETYTFAKSMSRMKSAMDASHAKGINVTLN